MQCPVCESTNVLPTTNSPSQHTCCDCFTTDSTAMFYAKGGTFAPGQAPREPAAPVMLADGKMLIESFPPDEVANAARIVEEYFKLRGSKTWAYAGLRSRDDDDMPTLDRIRVLAAAFNCEVIDRPTARKHENDAARYDFIRQTAGRFPISEHTPEFDLFSEWLSDVGAPDEEFDNAVDLGIGYAAKIGSWPRKR